MFGRKKKTRQSGGCDFAREVRDRTAGEPFPAERQWMGAPDDFPMPGEFPEYGSGWGEVPRSSPEEQAQPAKKRGGGPFARLRQRKRRRTQP